MSRPCRPRGTSLSSTWHAPVVHVARPCRGTSPSSTWHDPNRADPYYSVGHVARSTSSPPPPSLPSQQFLIRGSREAVGAAKSALIEAIEDNKRTAASTVMPWECVDALIGPNAEHLAALGDKYKVQIELPGQVRSSGCFYLIRGTLYGALVLPLPIKKGYLPSTWRCV